jgi:hypothetical protein
MSKLFSTFLVTAALLADSSRVDRQKVAETQKAASEAVTDAEFDPYVAVENAFKAEGYNDEEFKQIKVRLFSDPVAKKRWPFTDDARELTMSVGNQFNNNAGSVSEAISSAGGDPSNPDSLNDEEVRKKAQETLAAGDGTGGSLLQSSAKATAVPAAIAALGEQSAANYVAMEALTRTLSLTAGTVAQNTATLGRLGTAVATNAAYITALGKDVATLSQVTAPMMSLATQVGVPLGTVAQLSLAGSFVGPMLGVMALVYAAWPEEDVDPWLQVEARVAGLLDERFDQKRQRELGERQRRYVKQFSRCAQAWMAQSMTQLHGVTVPRWIVDEAKEAKAEAERTGTPFQMNFAKDHAFPGPRCMQQLEGHLALEQDQWYGTETGGFSGLFMPFANMHTQILSLLSDNPYDSKMQWPAALKATSAEYGNYVLDYLLKAWKSHACRTIRLRQNMAGYTAIGGTEYQFVVLKEVQQPNAGEHCQDTCGAAGFGTWCNFCGGNNDGACCVKGGKGICERFDVPAGHAVCVHTGCIQSNMAYEGTVLKAADDEVQRSPEECMHYCQAQEGATAFTSKGAQCICYSAKGERRVEAGASSGLTTCTATTSSLSENEDELAKNVDAKNRVPMEDIEPCEKSQAVGAWAEVEEKQEAWVKECLVKTGNVATVEFNRFNAKFGPFVDALAWKAGCGAQHAVNWEGDGMNKIAPELDGGSFGECNWEKEKKADADMWYFDEERKRGFWGKSKQSDDQKNVKMHYPIPAWLHDLRNVHICLKRTAAGMVEDVDDHQSSAVGTIMDPMAPGSGFERA